MDISLGYNKRIQDIGVVYMMPAYNRWTACMEVHMKTGYMEVPHIGPARKNMKTVCTLRCMKIGCSKRIERNKWIDCNNQIVCNTRTGDKEEEHQQLKQNRCQMIEII